MIVPSAHPVPSSAGDTSVAAADATPSAQPKPAALADAMAPASASAQHRRLLGLTSRTDAAPKLAETAAVTSSAAAQKRDIIERICRFLQIDRAVLSNWNFRYLSASETKNVALESCVERFVAGKMTDFERFAISIDSSEYHHSWILGNQHKTFARFYLRPDEKTTVKSVEETDRKLKIVISEGKDPPHVQTLSLEKTRDGVKLKISTSRKWLWDKSHSVRLDGLDWSKEPHKKSQSFGI